MKNQSLNAWLNAFFSGLFAAAIAYVGSNGLSILLYFFPVPLVVTGRTSSAAQSLLAIVACFLPLGFFLDPLSLLLLLSIGLPISIFFGSGLKKKASYGRMWSKTTALTAFFWLAMMAASKLFFQVDFVGEVERLLQNVFAEIIKPTAEALPPATVQELQLQINSSINMLMVILPSILILLASFFSGVNLLVSYYFLKLMKVEIKSLPAFSTASLPPSVKMGVIVTSLACIMLYFLGFTYWKEVAYNAATLFFFALIFQGLACVDAWMKPRMGLLGRVAFPLFMIFIAQLYPIYGIIGMLDLYFSLRKQESPGGNS